MAISTKTSDLVAIWPAEGKYANITWQVSDVCNYKCSYCNPGNFGANHRNLSADLYIENLREIITNFRNSGYKSFRFFFSGGEPSVWPPLIPVLEFIRSEVPGALVAVNTNLSRPLDWWEKHYKLFNDIVASFHVEFCDQDNYIRNMTFLQDKMDYIVCRLLMHDEKFKDVVDFSERIKSSLKNYTIEYAALIEALSPHSEMHIYKDEWKRDFLKTHTFEEQKTIPKQPGVPQSDASYCMEHYKDGTVASHNSNRLVNENMNDFRGWKCWINDAVFITPSGDIRLASCNMGKVIGNMNRKGIQFLNGPVICNQPRCNCGTDIGIRKAMPDFALSKE